MKDKNLDLVLEADRLAQEELTELVSAGQLFNKLCFVYCGEEKCNCTGGAYWKIYQKHYAELSDSINKSEGEEHLR